MIAPSVVEEIVALALQAPSGDNLQPWSIVLSADGVDLRFIPSLAASFLDPQHTASRIAFGALLENLELAGAARGVQASWELDPVPADPLLWARVGLSSIASRPSVLADAIGSRSTNRSPFDRKPLSTELLDALGFVREQGAFVEVFGTREEVADVADLVGIAEHVRSGIQAAHEDLHRCLRWTAEETERTRDGLDVRTLGVSALERCLLKLLSPWSLMRVVLPLGAAWLQGRYARRLARSASAFVWIGVLDFQTSSLVAAGRLMQRVWLTATSHGLEVSPFAALPLLGYVRKLDRAALTEVAERRLSDALARQDVLRGGRPGTGAMLLRIGRAKKPAVRALRRHPQLLSASEGY